MERRDLLRAGALTGAGALGAELVGCASNPARVDSAPASDQEIRAFVAKLDSGLHEIQSSRFVDGFVRDQGRRPIRAVHEPELERREELFREALGGLYLTQTFRELSVEAQLHPEVQQRMLSRIDRVDRNVFAMTELLENLSSEEHHELQLMLRRRPELPLQISERVDEQAARVGVSLRRRAQLRSMMTQTGFRLKHHAPASLIDEYVTKVRRATAPGGAHYEFALRLATEASERAFFAQYASSHASSGQLVNPSHAAARANVSPPSAPGSGTIKTGAILLGVGVVVFGVSAAVVSAGWFPGVVGITVGSLLFASGLVVLIVGALIRAFS